MKIVHTLAIAAITAVSASTAFAGGPSEPIETPPLILPDDDSGSMGSLMLGSLGGMAPAVIAAVVVAAAVAAADEGSSGGS